MRAYVRAYVPVMCVAISEFSGLCRLVGKADGFGSGAVSPNLGSCAVCACSRGSKRLAQQFKIIAIRANLFIGTAIECAWLGAWLCAWLCARLCARLCAWLCARLCVRLCAWLGSALHSLLHTPLYANSCPYSTVYSICGHNPGQLPSSSHFCP